MADTELTEEKAQEMVMQLADSKQTQHSFLTNVVRTKDTTRVGNLTPEELGVSRLPVRTFLELALFCKDIAMDKEFAEYFNAMSQIQTSTSLSKDAKLINLAATQKKELADMSPTPKGENRGWFKKRDKSIGSDGQS